MHQGGNCEKRWYVCEYVCAVWHTTCNPLLKKSMDVSQNDAAYVKTHCNNNKSYALIRGHTLCVCVCVLWLISCFCTLALEPSLQEKASRWSLGISVLWNALWTCWPPPPCHRHTPQSLVCCHDTHMYKIHISNTLNWIYQRNTLPSLDCYQGTEKKKRFTISFQRG